MSRHDSEKLAEQLSAYLDGELSEADRDRVEAILKSDPSARARLESLRNTVELVHQLPRRSAPTDLAGDVMASIERGELLGEGGGTPVQLRPAFRVVRSLLLTAAVLAATVTVGLWVRDMTPERRPLGKVAEGPSGDVELEEPGVDVRSPMQLGTKGEFNVETAVDALADEVKPQILAQVRPEVAGPSNSVALELADASPDRTDDMKFSRSRSSASQPPAPEQGASLNAVAAPKSAMRFAEASRPARVAPETESTPVRLEITCTSVEDLRWCQRRLAMFLANQRTVDPTGASAKAATVQRHLSATESRVNLTERDIDRLMNVFKTGSGARRQVELAVLEFASVPGGDQARPLLSTATSREQPMRSRKVMGEVANARDQGELSMEKKGRPLRRGGQDRTESRAAAKPTREVFDQTTALTPQPARNSSRTIPVIIRLALQPSRSESGSVSDGLNPPVDPKNP